MTKNEYQREWNRRYREKHGISPVTAFRRRNPDANEIHRDRERQRWYSSPEVRERHRLTCKAHRDKLKDECFAAYGGYICSCCGETIRLFLTLDHTANDGAKDRRENPTSSSGLALYGRLKRLGYPAGLQVLCWNCNGGKRMNNGVCPHIKD